MKKTDGGPEKWGKKVVDLLKERGSTQKWLEVEAGMQARTLTIAISEDRNISAVKGLAIAKALQVPVTWLFDPDQGCPPPAPVEPNSLNAESMSKLEMFTKAAMKGLDASGWNDGLVRECCDFAEAMLAEVAKREAERGRGDGD